MRPGRFMGHRLRVPSQRRLPTRWTTRLGVGLCLALVATGCGGVPGLGGSSRSEENFCKELKAGNERMKEHYTSAGEDVPSQLALIAQEVGEYTRLVHRLDDRA